MKSWINNTIAALGLFVFGAGAALADGIGGCVDSPENPTLLLGLIGAAAAAVPRVRAEIRSRFGGRA